MNLGDRISAINQELVGWCERIIALALLVGVLSFFLATLRMALDLDWKSLATLHEISQRILLMTIGLELVRTLISHELSSLINLMSFVIARRMLEPQILFWEIPLGVAAFAALMATRKYLMNGVQKTAGAEDTVENGQ
ncbi:hypothetical protein [Desulfomonile tiedjei]|uniref:DUF1622 domain-containing protein n=1 Tax=Desulfomonile tiedjei (strain ATCC 49306 / DSM 6799 / DCB-1) TaxID=706587 RepID=I4C6I6_DESTA|nr:hypothetical protein [Desulfomonile tiedjei]AFM25177.1 hypothetical protein Desti_2497 [Desulfomonile tiedjei DSM 6799]